MIIRPHTESENTLFFFLIECIELRYDQKYENKANKDPLSGKIDQTPPKQTSF